MDSIPATEVLLNLDKSSTKPSQSRYFGIVLTAGILEEVLQCVRSFQQAHRDASTLQVQIHESPWHGGFYSGEMDDHDPTNPRIEVQEMLVGEFTEARDSFEVDPGGCLISVPEEEAFVGVQWRAYDPSSEKRLHSSPLSLRALKELRAYLDRK